MQNSIVNFSDRTFYTRLFPSNLPWTVITDQIRRLRRACSLRDAILKIQVNVLGVVGAVIQRAGARVGRGGEAVVRGREALAVPPENGSFHRRG